jgi:hypothetical protein
VERDVEALWCGQAAAMQGNEEEPLFAWVLGGLGYYARVSKRCAAEAAALEARRAKMMEDGW